MAKPYKNAAEVLPPKILAEVQKYHIGLLWVPKRRDFYRERIELIRKLLLLNVSISEIAEIGDISPRRVLQIKRSLTKTSDPAP